jgi:deazaflavin-dependent oxidoreductase (nitroreductase family)
VPAHVGIPPGGWQDEAVPSDFFLKSMNNVHRVALKLTGGRKGWDAWGMPVIELTTTGRKSGKLHTCLLTSPLQEGDTYVVVASRGGDDRHPAWFLNLRDEPKVEVAVKGGPARPMVATVASAEERARLWPRITADHKNYADYQTKTEREIPVILLSPAAAA